MQLTRNSKLFEYSKIEIRNIQIIVYKNLDNTLFENSGSVFVKKLQTLVLNFQ